jgi:hypothetical protein
MSVGNVQAAGSPLPLWSATMADQRSWPLELGRPGQDRLLEVLELAAGLQAQVLDQQSSHLPVDAQRLGMPPGAMQRQHQLCVEPLAKRVLGGQRGQLGNQRGVPSKREIGVDAQLQCREALLHQL